MGFKYDVTNVPTVEEGWRKLLVRLEAEFDGIGGPAVHRRHDEPPGLLLMLERCIASEHYDIAAGIVEDLRSNKARWLGQLASAKARRHPEWHARVKPVWMRLDRRLGYSHCVREIRKRLGDCALPDDRQIKRAIKQWEEEEHAAKKV
jgi:hypothetical protein